MLVVKPVEKSEEENGKKRQFSFTYLLLKEFFNKDTIKFYFSTILYSITIIHLCDLIVKNLGPVSHVLTDNGPNPFFSKLIPQKSLEFCFPICAYNLS